jgi:hypothetical protein
MFLFVNDTINTKLGAFIVNGTITASCNSVLMVPSNGYFTSSACTTDLTILNIVNGATIFYAATVTPTIIYTVKLSRFVFPTI